MEIKVGEKIRGSEIVWVSEDKRVFGVYSPDDLGRLCAGLPGDLH